jgi:hypothetical protein
MISTRTERSLKKVKALGKSVVGYFTFRENGNHSINFSDVGGKVIATVTIDQIIGKRKKPTKKAKK